MHLLVLLLILALLGSVALLLLWCGLTDGRRWPGAGWGCISIHALARALRWRALAFDLARRRPEGGVRSRRRVAFAIWRRAGRALFLEFGWRGGRGSHGHHGSIEHGCRWTRGYGTAFSDEAGMYRRR